MVSFPPPLSGADTYRMDFATVQIFSWMALFPFLVYRLVSPRLSGLALSGLY